MIKDYSTNFRTRHLQEFPELASLEQWGKYSMLPLDVPRFEHPEIVSWFFDNCKIAKKLQSENRGMGNDGTGKAWWQTVDFSPTGEVSEFGDAWETNFHQEFLTLFPDFMEKVNEYLPFNTIRRVRLWASIKDVPYHQEPGILIDFPSTFRIVLHDTNPAQTLSVKDIDRNIIPLPRVEDTNTYAWNNLRVQNGSTFNPGYRNIVVLFHKYELDIDRFNDLMQRSVTKYNDVLLEDTRPITDYINL